MVTTNTSTIGTTARDHATITIWEAATDLDLVATDTIEIGECFDDTRFEEIVVIASAAGDTDSTHYRILRAASGEGHDGTVSGAQVTNFTTGGGHAFHVSESFFQLGAGMLIQLGAPGSSDECVHISDGVEGLLIEKAILYTVSNASSIDGVYSGDEDVGTAANPITIRNCVISGMPRAGLHAQQHSAATPHDLFYRVINCTITDCGRGIGWRAAHADGTTTIEVINTGIGDSGTADFADSGGSNPGTLVTTGSAGNYDEDNTCPAGTTMVLLESAGAGGSEWLIVNKYNDHKLVNSGDNDVLLGGVGNGSNSLVPTDDFLGNDRGSVSTCDPGCHQVSTPPSAGTRNRVHVA